jgi:hypothetical protein
MILVRDFLLPRRGKPSLEDLAAFLRENPRIEQTFRTHVLCEQEDLPASADSSQSSDLRRLIP